MTDAQWSLVADNVRLVGFIARQFGQHNQSIVESPGFDALLDCARGFNPSLGVRFSTYAGRSIYRSMRRAVERADRVKVRSISEVVGNAEFFEPGYLDSRIDSDAIEWVWSQCTERERAILQARYYDDLDYSTIADRFGYASPESARQTVYVILRRLREAEGAIA